MENDELKGKQRAGETLRLKLTVYSLTTIQQQEQTHKHHLHKTALYSLITSQKKS